MARPFGLRRFRFPLREVGQLTHRVALFRFHSTALVGYFVVALTFAWPLPTSLSTHLTGPTGGDTGVYVWNQWVFWRETANLGQHNYTVLANTMALPLIQPFGTVAAFNLTYLALGILSAYAMM